MGLFNIKWRRSYDADIPRRLDMSDSMRQRSHNSRSADNIIIHIDEIRPFSMHIANLASFRILSKTSNSICFLMKYKDDESEILIAKWAKTKPEVSSRDHITVRIASDVINVPQYRLKEVFRHYNKFVSIGIRTYIPGQTLQSVYSSMTDDDIDAVFMQIQSIMWLLAKKTSTKFGHINEGQFSSSTPIGYLRIQSFFNIAAGTLCHDDWKEQGNDNYTAMATLCHGNLSPEHIIVDGNNVVGIVGWTNADFMPEAYEKLKYYFRSNPSDPNCWFKKLACVTTCPETGRPSVEFVLNLIIYIYRISWNSANAERRQVINRLYKSITTDYTQLNCIALATQLESDNMSLQSLSTNTWSQFSCSTVMPDI